MSYVRKVTSANERLLAIFSPHWIYVLEGFLWFFALLIIGLIIDHYFYKFVGPDTLAVNVNIEHFKFNGRLTGISTIFAVIGLAILWVQTLIFVSSEIGLTDQRIIHKKGLVFIQVDQVDLEDIRAEQVFHGWLGWLLGYGRIHLDCRFIQDVWLPAISQPYRLVKASHTARLKHPLIEYGLDEFQGNMESIEKHIIERKKMQNKLSTIKKDIKNRFKKAA